MSCIKNNYEENFDSVTSYTELKRSGLTEEEIRFQWECFSNKSWEEFKEN